jgi:hypothetical protein
MSREKSPADPTIRQALAQDWRRPLQRATRLGKRADVRKEWLKDREWRRDPARAEAAQREGFRKEVQQALVGQEHWLREQVEARKAEPVKQKARKAKPPSQKRRVRPGPKAPYNWELLDSLFAEDRQAHVSTLCARYKERNNGLGISDRTLGDARRRFIKTGKSEPE